MAQTKDGQERTRRSKKVNGLILSASIYANWYKSLTNFVRRLEKNGQLYVTPAGFLDDYYWMLASVSDQKNSSNSTSFAVSAEQAAREGRFPGARPMVLSNDLMRDHRLELFDPRLFRRWTASHIVNYDFTAFVNDECRC